MNNTPHTPYQKDSEGNIQLITGDCTYADHSYPAYSKKQFQAAVDEIELLKAQIEAHSNDANRFMLETAKLVAKLDLMNSQELLSDNYIQTVPDKCDRIIWKGNYLHLPGMMPDTPKDYVLVPRAPNYEMYVVLEDMLTNCHSIGESYSDLLLAAQRGYNT